MQIVSLVSTQNSPLGPPYRQRPRLFRPLSGAAGSTSGMLKFSGAGRQPAAPPKKRLYPEDWTAIRWAFPREKRLASNLRRMNGILDALPEERRRSLAEEINRRFEAWGQPPQADPLGFLAQQLADMVTWSEDLRLFDVDENQMDRILSKPGYLYIDHAYPMDQDGILAQQMRSLAQSAVNLFRQNRATEEEEENPYQPAEDDDLDEPLRQTPGLFYETYQLPAHNVAEYLAPPRSLKKGSQYLMLQLDGERAHLPVSNESQYPLSTGNLLDHLVDRVASRSLRKKQQPVSTAYQLIRNFDPDSGGERISPYRIKGYLSVYQRKYKERTGEIAEEVAEHVENLIRHSVRDEAQRKPGSDPQRLLKLKEGRRLLATPLPDLSGFQHKKPLVRAYREVIKQREAGRQVFLDLAVADLYPQGRSAKGTAVSTRYTS